MANPRLQLGLSRQGPLLFGRQSTRLLRGLCTLDGFWNGAQLSTAWAPNAGQQDRACARFESAHRPGVFRLVLRQLDARRDRIPDLGGCVLIESIRSARRWGVAGRG